MMTFALCAGFISAQKSPVKILTDREVNFLFNYYEQDGSHSPVTGGIGTEKLDCSTPLTIVHVPFDSVKDLSVNFGFDYYTSASCNRIDRFITSASSKFLSSASSHDMRTHLDVDYSRRNLSRNSAHGGFAGYSNEFDVNSFSIGYHYNKSFNNENSELGIKSSVFFDRWKLIYPGEIRNGEQYRYGNDEQDYDHDNRLTGTLSFTWSQVLTRKLQIVLLSDLVYQNGILNTPFHRVYFDDGLNLVNPDTNYLLIAKTMYPENLPRTRFKVPIGVRGTWYISDRIVSRFYYRWYTDDFGIRSHTASIELPVKLTSWLMMYPFYRYYIQTASDYFAPFGMHPLNEQFQPLNPFYTSDYDLSAFTMQKYGLGARISPVYGIYKWKWGEKGKLTFKYMDFRYAHYRRSDGLKAGTISIDAGFVF
jgi:hypothetical protein